MCFTMNLPLKHLLYLVQLYQHSLHCLVQQLSTAVPLKTQQSWRLLQAEQQLFQPKTQTSAITTLANNEAFLQKVWLET